MGEWKIVSVDKPLQPGDKVRITFKTPGPFWMKAIQAAAIESALEKKESEGYIIRRIDYMTPGNLIIYFDIIKTNPVVVTILIITGAVLLVSAAASMAFEKGEQFFETPAVSTASAAFLIIAIIFLLKTVRK